MSVDTDPRPSRVWASAVAWIGFIIAATGALGMSQEIQILAHRLDPTGYVDEITSALGTENIRFYSPYVTFLGGLVFYIGYFAAKKPG